MTKDLFFSSVVLLNSPRDKSAYGKNYYMVFEGACKHASSVRSQLEIINFLFRRTCFLIVNFFLKCLSPCKVNKPE